MLTDEQMQILYEALPKPPEDAVFQPEKITAVSLPHPYCITPKHVHYAADHCGGVLGEGAIQAAESQGAHCGIHGCSLSYSQHETQITLVVVVPPGTRYLNAVPGLHAYLLATKEKAQELGIQGYAFPSHRGAL